MKAIQIMAPKKVVVVELPVPAVGDHEVLITVACCVTCPHWDIAVYKGVDMFDRPGYPRYPSPPGWPGHEMAGQVVKVGAKVTGCKAGDRVVTLVSRGETNPGFYAEFVSLPENIVVGIPAEVSYESGASMEMARHIVHYIRLLGNVVGKRTGVTGVGPAGLIALQMLKALGAADVVAVDINAERLKLAEKLGATETVNSATDEILLLKARPLSATVDCSGSAAGLQIALDHTPQGVVSIFGIPHGETIYATRNWGTKLLSSGWGEAAPTVDDTQFVLALWRRKLLDTASLITVKLPFERYAEGIEMLIAKKAVRVGFYPG